MFKKLLFIISALIMAGGIVTTSWADVPAPPVNQNLGIPDGVYEGMAKENCWYCHVPHRVTPEIRASLGWTFPSPVTDPTLIDQRHHNRNETPIQSPTQAPNPGQPGDTYQCLNCHLTSVVDPETGMRIVEKNFEDCTNCHLIMDDTSVHHVTKPAQDKNCQHCHGSLVDNPDDGHYIVEADRVATTMTPRTQMGRGPGGSGACTFCHAPSNWNIPDGSLSGIPSNRDSHHFTGIGQPIEIAPGVPSALDCELCHDMSVTRAGDYEIRRCQNCHGILSLHNIQYDSGNDGIIFGDEIPGYGHIGNSPQDCNGCHGEYLTYKGTSMGVADYSGPAIPTLTGMSPQSIVAGSAVGATLSGLALTNRVITSEGGERTTATVKSAVTVTSADGTVVTVMPDSLSENSLSVTLPALSPGNYMVRATKAVGSIKSNPMALSVLPHVVIGEVSVSGDTLIIAGSGFGGHLDAVDSGTSVTMRAVKVRRGVSRAGAAVACSVDSWTDGEIVANCGTAACGSLKVDGIFGSAVKDVSCN